MKRSGLVCGLVALAAVIAGPGCASIVNGTRQSVSVFASPAGSRVTIYDGSGSVVTAQATPCTVKLKRGSGFFSSGEYRVQSRRRATRPLWSRSRGHSAGGISWGTSSSAA